MERFPDAETIQAWLVSQVGELLRVSLTEISVRAPLTRYGLDSITATILTGDLGQWLGRQLSPTLLYRYDSLEALARHLAEDAQTEAPPAPLDSMPERAGLARGQRTEYPLSHGQRALWFLHQLDPHSAAYTIMFAVRILSPVDVQALQRAFQSLVNRHAALRTTFTARTGEPVQVVHHQVEVSFHHVDASGWSQADVHSRLVDQAHRPFDLEHGPLFKVSLFTQSAQEHVLLLTVHHIVADLWSLVVLMDELRVLYPSYHAGALVRLPPLGAQYSDLIHWQAEMLAGPQGRRLASYWETRLGGDLPLLNLPTDRPRPPVQTYHGASHPFRLDQALSRRLESLAKDEGVTPYVLLLAAFQVLLHRYTGQDDILVGSPVAGRSRPEFFGIVGYLVNPVVLRADLSGNPPFKSFLARVRETVLEALEHQDYAFPLLVERLQPARDASRSPVFQAMFAFEKPHRLDEQGIGRFVLGQADGHVNLGGLVLEPIALEQQASQFDLTLTMVEAGETFWGYWQYNTDLFDAITIARMAGHFQVVLDSIAADPDQAVANLPLLTEAERRQIVVEWNDTQADYPRDACVPQLFEAQVERTPDAVAVVFEGRSLTYRELNQRSNQLSNRLRKLGVGLETPVAICIDRSLEMIVAALGVLKAGGAYLPLDPGYPPDRLAFILEDSRAPVLLTQASLLPELPVHRAQMICLDATWTDIAEESGENPAMTATPNNLAYIIYTSGSTGQPKGTLLEHRGLCNLVTAHIHDFEIGPGSRVLQFLSFSFDASVGEIFSALLSGATLCLARRQTVLSMPDLHRLLQEQAVSIVFLPPAALSALPAHGLPALQTVVSGGESCTREIVARWSPGRRLVNIYGPTEATVASSWFDTVNLHKDATHVPIGRPIINVQYYILDRHRQPAPVGVPGELYIGGVGLARGYLNRPELTADKFVPNPFDKKPFARLYRTGDLVRYLPSGDVEFLGRIDQQVKIRGFRVELGEIEAVLGQHPAVQEAVVLAREDTRGDKQRLVAYVVYTQPAAPSVGELRRFLKNRLPEYMLPSAFVTLNALPLTPNGKLDRRALPAPGSSHLFLEIGHAPIPPRDRLEYQLGRLWEEVLGMPAGIHDSFFDLGGHSLLAVRLIARIEQTLGKAVRVDTLFQAPTIEQLAAILRRNGEAPAWSTLMALQPGGSKPPFFCVAASYGDLLAFVELARHLGTDQPFFRLQPPGPNGNGKSIQRVHALAAHYVDELRTVQPVGPYYLGGYCAGGLVAWEVAQQLQAQGQPVALLALLETHDLAATSVDSLMYYLVQAFIDRFPRLGAVFKHRVFQNAFDDWGAEVNLRALRNYKARAYAGKTVLFLAERSPVKWSPAARRWRKLASGGLDVCPVPGGHTSFIREPHHASVLAEQLKARLAAARMDHA